MNNPTTDQSDITNETAVLSAKSACCGIYGLRNKITGKWYIGQSRNIKKRWEKAYKPMRCQRQPKIYNALKKYSYDGFEKVVIETCDDVDWIRDYREIFWIRQLNSIENGYNLKEGGTTGTHTEETRKKLKIINTGKRLTDATKEKIRLARARQTFSSESREKAASKKRGKKMSDEFCQKAKLNALKREESRKVSGYYLNRSSTENQKIAWKKLQGHVVTKETRQKISAANKGRKLSPDHVERIQKMNTGRIPSTETRQKISASGKGRKMSDSAKEKIRQWNLGKKRSPETCKRISEAKRRTKLTEQIPSTPHH